MSANSFMSGFTGGMTAMNSMMDSAEQRKYRQKAYQDEQDQRQFSSMLHLYNQADEAGKQAIQQDFADQMNNDPAIQSILSRNVGHNEQKRISPTLGQFTKDGFVPIIDVFDGRTGKVIRTGPLTEFGNSDGSDKPVAISNDDLITTIGRYAGKTGFGAQMEARLIQAGGAPPQKTETYRQEERNGQLLNISNKTNQATSLGKVGSGSGSGGSLASEKPIQTWKIDTDAGEVNVLIHKYGDEYVRTEISPDGKEKRMPYTEQWQSYQQNPGNTGSGVAERMGVGGKEEAAAEEGNQPANQEGLGVLSPEHLPGGMQSEPEQAPVADKANKPAAEKPAPARLTDKRNLSSVGNPYLHDEEVRQRYKNQVAREKEERPARIKAIKEDREKSRQKSEERQQAIAKNRSNIRMGMSPPEPEPEAASTSTLTPEEQALDIPDKDDFDKILKEAKTIADTKGKEALTEYLNQFDEHTQRKLTQKYFKKTGMGV